MPCVGGAFVQHLQGGGAQLLRQLVVHLVCKGHGLQKDGRLTKGIDGGYCVGSSPLMWGAM